MIIILEGTDLAGKTTLADKIVEQFRNIYGYGGIIRHYGPPAPEEAAPGMLFANLLVQLTKDYYSAARDGVTEKLFIYDRFHVGDAVYGDGIFREKPYLTTAELMVIDDVCDRLNVRKVFVDPGPEIIAERYEEREEALSLTEVLSARRKYQALLTSRPTLATNGLGEKLTMPPILGGWERYTGKEEFEL